MEQANNQVSSEPSVPLGLRQSYSDALHTLHQAYCQGVGPNLPPSSVSVDIKWPFVCYRMLVFPGATSTQMVRLWSDMQGAPFSYSTRVHSLGVSLMKVQQLSRPMVVKFLYHLLLNF